MPRAKKVIAPLTPAEIKAKKADLKTALKLNAETLKPYQVSLKEAFAAVATAKKEADKALAAAQKVHAAAETKFTKAKAASETGVTKIQAQLAALEPASVE